MLFGIASPLPPPPPQPPFWRERCAKVDCSLSHLTSIVAGLNSSITFTLSQLLPPPGCWRTCVCAGQATHSARSTSTSCTATRCWRQRRGPTGTGRPRRGWPRSSSSSRCLRRSTPSARPRSSSGTPSWSVLLPQQTSFYLSSHLYRDSLRDYCNEGKRSWQKVHKITDSALCVPLRCLYCLNLTGCSFEWVLEPNFPQYKPTFFGVTSIRWWKWFTETGQIITVTGQIHSCLS